MDRPRKISAKNANKTFGEDEEVQDIKLTFEAKIDRWNGFTPEMYKKEVIEEWEKVEEERKKLKAQQLEEKIKEKAAKPKTDMDEIMSDSDLDEESDGEVKNLDVDENNPDYAKNPRIKSLNKNLRSRTETAKYLVNIYDNSVHYDGKSRKLLTVPDPDGNTDGKDDNPDNARIYTGQYLNLMDQDNFIKEAKEKGDVELNTVSMPSQAELAFKNFKLNKKNLLTDKQKELFEKYGGQEHEMPEDVKIKIMEEQKEAILKLEKEKEDKAKAKIAKVQVNDKGEDIFPNGHSYPWGSFKHPTFGTGYKCCYGFEKEEKCKGERGVKEFFAKEYELKYNKKPDADIEKK